MEQLTLRKGETNLVYLKGVYDEAAQAYDNAAAVRITGIVGEDGASLAGYTYPITGAYQAGSKGNYLFVLPPNDNIIPGAFYRATITGTGANGGTIQRSPRLEGVLAGRE